MFTLQSNAGLLLTVVHAIGMFSFCNSTVSSSQRSTLVYITDLLTITQRSTAKYVCHIVIFTNEISNYTDRLYYKHNRIVRIIQNAQCTMKKTPCSVIQALKCPVEQSLKVTAFVCTSGGPITIYRSVEHIIGRVTDRTEAFLAYQGHMSATQ